MRHIAVEGRCFVLSACQHLRRGDLPDDWDTELGDWAGNPSGDVMIRGGAVIVDPFGEVLAGPIYDEDALLVAEIDPGAITRADYVVTTLAAEIRHGHRMDNPTEVWAVPYDREQLERDFTRVHSLMRAFDLEVATVWQRKRGEPER